MGCYTRAELRARVASGRWLQVFYGSYRHCSGEPSARLLHAAACLSLGREAPACLQTAASLHGFGVLVDDVTHVAVGDGQACLRRGALWPHQLVLASRDLVRLRCGALVTSADRTAVDLARTVSRLDVLPMLDAALASGVCTPETLAAELTRHVGLRGVRQARELLPMADPLSESPQESRLRLLCHDHGLPTPELQVPVVDASGRARRWLDIGWKEARVGLEYDGEQGHSEWVQRRADRRRHNFLQDDDWAMFYATDHDVYIDPAPLMAQVAAAIRRRSQRGARGERGDHGRKAV